MQSLEWERGQLRGQLQQDRAEFTQQAKLLSNHFTVSQHRSTALQVAHEAVQVKLRDLLVVLYLSGRSCECVLTLVISQRSRRVHTHILTHTHTKSHSHTHT